MSTLWFHLFPVLSSFGSISNNLPKPGPAHWKMSFSLSTLTHHNPLASQRSFAVLQPDPALVLPLPQSDNVRTSERWSLTAWSLQQTRSLICKESAASLFSYPWPAAGLARDRTLWDSSCNSSKSALSMHELSFLQNLRNLVKLGLTRDHNLLPTSTHFFGSCSAEQAVPRNLRKGNENFWNHTFQVSICARKLLSYLGWNQKK